MEVVGVNKIWHGRAAKLVLDEVPQFRFSFVWGLG